jgi:hypothetical protein
MNMFTRIAELPCPNCKEWIDISIMRIKYECPKCKRMYTLERQPSPAFDADLGYYDNSIKYKFIEIEG